MIVAKPIRVIQPVAEPPVHDPLHQAIHQHQESLTQLIHDLAALEQSTLFRMLRGFLAESQDVWAIVVNQLDQPGPKNAIRNLEALMTFLGRIPSDQWSRILDGVAHALDRYDQAIRAPESPRVSAWRLWQDVKDPHVSRALTAVFAFLGALGDAASKAPPPSDHIPDAPEKPES